MTYKITSRPTIGNRYHLYWAKKGCVFILKAMNSDNIHGIVETPKSKKQFRIKLSDLFLLNETAYHYKPI